jgi:hypothetical protein
MSLSGQEDNKFRQIGDGKPVFAFSKDLGVVDTIPSEPFRLSIGRYRSPAISWTATKDAHPDRDLFYHSKYPDLQSSVSSIRCQFAMAWELTRA